MRTEIVSVKCMDGKFRSKTLTGIYCKHYKFSRDYRRAGCCYNKKDYEICKYEKSNPRECESFIFKYERKVDNARSKTD